MYVRTVEEVIPYHRYVWVRYVVFFSGLALIYRDLGGNWELYIIIRTRYILM